MANALAVELSLMFTDYSYLTLGKSLTSLLFFCYFLTGRVDMLMEPAAYRRGKVSELVYAKGAINA